MWIKTKGRFRDPNVSDTEWDLMDEDTRMEAAIWNDFRFDLEGLGCYNEYSRDQNNTTIRLKNGYDITVEMSVAELDKKVFDPSNQNREYQWQLCPRCMGNKQISISPISTIGNPTMECNICNGEGIISIATGKPPQK